MTIEGFLGAVAACYPWHYWQLDADGRIRTRLGPWEQSFCPITALARAQLDISYTPNAVWEVAEELDLHIDDATDLIYAADNDAYRHPHVEQSMLSKLGIFV